jgi:hypothetical protein
LKISIGFSTPKKFNPVSWLVRKMTGSQVSHAWFLYWDDEFGMNMVMEAHELGFRILPFEAFAKKNKVVKIARLEHDITVGMTQVANEYLGTMYDYLGLVGMFFVIVGRLFGKKLKNPFAGKQRVFCSEGVVRAMKLSPGYEDLDIDPDTEGPQELMELLTK